MEELFIQAHCDRYGFNVRGRLFRLGQIAVKAVARQAVPAIAISRVATELTPLAHVSVYSKGQWHKVLVYGRDRLPAHHYY